MTATDLKDNAADKTRPALRASALSIRLELLGRAFWAPVSVVLLFLGIAFSDVLPVLPAVLHGAVLAFLAVLLGFALFGVTSAFRPIGGDEAARRLERSSGLLHRPISALFDQPAASKLTAEGKTLWNAHVARAAAVADDLRVPKPEPGIAALDKKGLRFIPVMVLIVGVLISGGNVLAPLERALNPIGGASQVADARMDLWITPPSYTGLAPMVFQGIGSKPEIDPDATGEAAPDAVVDAEPQTLIVPVGSQILVHATDARQQPQLIIGEASSPLPQLGEDSSRSYKLEMEVGADFVDADRLSLRIGNSEVAGWPVRIAPDTAPQIEFTRAPTTRRDTQLDVEYLARDDYGVQTINMEIRRPGGQRVPGGEDVIRVEVPVSGDRRNLETTFARDLSAHPWAGLPVKVILRATDTAEQSATTQAGEVVLPERIFTHPVSQALIEARKTLNDFDKDVVEVVARQLQELSYRPTQFFDDTVAFLSIRSAFGRLAYTAREDELESNVASVQRLLWETALRIEDGEFALAESDLMRMQDEAMQALREGKLGEELERVMQELQEAMDRYMEALADRLQEMGLDQIPPMQGMDQMQTQDLQQMLDQIQELAQTGNTEAAEQMLAQMQQMLEQLRQGMQMQQNNPAMAEAREIMDQLRALTEDQQQLLDETFQESQRNSDQGQLMPPSLQEQMQRQLQRQQQQGQQQGQQQQGEQQGQQSPPSAEQQQALRQRLGELMMQMDEAFGQIPENMGRAEQQMDQAGRNMGKGEFRDAAGNQSQALQELREATNQMAEQMAQQFGQQMGLSMGNQPGPGGQQGTDPFGRRDTNENGQGTAIEDADVTVPTERELRRAREIIDELRRRSGEQFRPQIELDYIDRLLDIF